MTPSAEDTDAVPLWLRTLGTIGRFGVSTRGAIAGLVLTAAGIVLFGSLMMRDVLSAQVAGVLWGLWSGASMAIAYFASRRASRLLGAHIQQASTQLLDAPRASTVGGTATSVAVANHSEHVEEKREQPAG